MSNFIGNFIGNFTGYFESRGTKSENGHPYPPVRSDICRPIFGSQLRNGNIPCSVFSLFNFRGKQTRFIKSSDDQIQELVADAVPENTKKSTKYGVNVFEGE